MAKVSRILKSTQGIKSRLDPALNDGACAALMVKQVLDTDTGDSKAGDPKQPEGSKTAGSE
jgi:hypothetical protein